MILGTAAYMAPEQAKGRPTDKRADIWAFGCVFYEMLTGRRAFQGEDVSDTLAAVLRGEPDWTALPSGVSANVTSVIQALPRTGSQGACSRRLGDSLLASGTTRCRPVCAERNVRRSAWPTRLALAALVMTTSQAL